MFTSGYVCIAHCIYINNIYIYIYIYIYIPYLTRSSLLGIIIYIYIYIYYGYIIYNGENTFIDIHL